MPELIVSDKPWCPAPAASAQRRPPQSPRRGELPPAFCVLPRCSGQFPVVCCDGAWAVLTACCKGFQARGLHGILATHKCTLNRTSLVGPPPVETRSSGIERNCPNPVVTMTTDLIKCQCNTACQCRVEPAKAVMRNGKAFCCEPCADGLGCGCR